MKNPYSARHRHGFTLIEMLVVITIIVVLAGLSVSGFKYVTDKQANDQARVQISLLSKALEDYKLDNGSYPPSAGGTNGLYKALYWDTNNDGSGPPGDTDQKIYLSELDPENNRQGWIEGTGSSARIVDPWGNEFIYVVGTGANNPDFDLSSNGKDNTGDTSDDITNY